MKYLLHSSHATYNSTTKKWIFDLDRRISNPTVIRLAKATFTTPGDLSVHPAVIYMRSDALARMISKKHTVELRDLNHESNSNVIATLTETHARGRYRIIGGPTFPVNPNSSERQIDIYFTDGDTILEGETGSGGGGSSSTASATDADIAAFTDLLAWIDFAPARTLDNSFVQVDTAGDEVRYLYNRSPAPQTLVFVGNNPLELATLGNGLGAIQDSGYAFIDSTTPTADFDQEWQCHHIFQAQSNFGQGTYMFDLYYGAFLCDPSGACKVLNGSGGTTVTALSNMTWIPLRAYLVTFNRVLHDLDGDGNDEYCFYIRLEDLSDTTGATVSTEYTLAGRVHDGAEHTIMLGRSVNYWRDHIGGPMIIHNGTNATEGDQARAWLRSWYTGESTSSESSSETSALENATFFAELEIETT